MRWVVLTRLACGFMLLAMLGSCSVLRLNEGREFAALSAENSADVFPMIIIKTSVFSCRGDGAEWGSGASGVDIS